MRIKKILVTIGLIFGVGILSFSSVGAVAIDPFEDTCSSNPDSAVCQSQDDDLMSMVKIIVNTLLYVLGAVSVVMIIYGGIRYTISAGDSSAVTNAKNTILYAVVGLVVAILAYAIVNFVVGVFS